MEKPKHLKYLIANENDLRWGLTINTVGYQKIAPGDEYPPSVHPNMYHFSVGRGRKLDEYQLVYITKGQGQFSSQSSTGPDRTMPLREGNMFLLFPGEWHNYRPDMQTGWEEYWIGFRGEVVTQRVENGFFSKSHPVLSLGLHNEVVELYQTAIRTATQQRVGFQQVLAGVVNMLLGLAYSFDRNYIYGGTETDNQINKAKLIILENFRKIRPEQVARMLNMSYSSFRKVFKQYTGFAPAQYINELRIQKAKELITNTDMPIKEVAYMMGFENHEYFFTAFRKNSGLTPLEFRRQTRLRHIGAAHPNDQGPHTPKTE